MWIAWCIHDRNVHNKNNTNRYRTQKNELERAKLPIGEMMSKDEERRMRDAETTEAYPTTPSVCLSESLDNESQRQPRQNLNLNTSCIHGSISRTLICRCGEMNVGTEA